MYRKKANYFHKKWRFLTRYSSFSYSIPFSFLKFLKHIGVSGRSSIKICQPLFLTFSTDIWIDKTPLLTPTSWPELRIICFSTFLFPISKRTKGYVKDMYVLSKVCNMSTCNFYYLSKSWLGLAIQIHIRNSQ